MSYRFRDRETGQFASREDWEEDHGRGGRYIREHIEEETEQESEEEAVESLDDWYDYYDEMDFDTDFDPTEFMGGIDTGRKK